MIDFCVRRVLRLHVFSGFTYFIMVKCVSEFAEGRLHTVCYACCCNVWCKKMCVCVYIVYAYTMFVNIAAVVLMNFMQSQAICDFCK
jgi:hypothetical protein